MSNNIKSLIRDIIIVLVVVLVVTFFIKPIIVKQTSMTPTLQENNYLFVSKQAYRFSDPKRGQIIVFPTDANGEEELYIKRIIGLPGDTIDIKDGEVYVNGDKKNQDYTRDGYTPGDVDSFKVPEGQLYVMGDNRVDSIDSRYEEIGTVSIDEVTGVAFLRLWPLNEIGFLKVEK
ncbi:MAG: signal peptidase I [Eubacteriaceae bacterium]|nr:signal peptidase I [Eubacteriaceae bacterium]